MACFVTETDLFSSASFVGRKGGVFQSDTAFNIGEGKRLGVGVEWIALCVALAQLVDVFGRVGVVVVVGIGSQM